MKKSTTMTTGYGFTNVAYAVDMFYFVCPEHNDYNRYLYPT